MLPGALDHFQPLLPRGIFNIFIEYGDYYEVVHGSEKKEEGGRKEKGEENIKGCRGRKKGLAENNQWKL